MLVGLLVLCFISVYTTDGVEGATLKVGPGETYADIQDAVDDASSGDTVQVAAGTYHEDIVIDVDIVVHGNTQANTIINGTGSGNTVTINVPGVDLSKFTIKGSGSGSRYAGVYLVNSTNSTISEVTIEDLSSHGIRLDSNCSDTTIDDCTIMRNSRNGIYVKGSSFVTIDSTTSSENDWNGIYMSSRCDNSTLTKNICEDNGDNGIYLYSQCFDALIEDNDCQSNDDNGIWMSTDNDNCTIKDNSFDSNSQTGITIYRSRNTIVKDNECESMGQNGISLSSCRNLMATGNICNDNDQRGIFIYNAWNVTLDGNECKSNGINGIDILSTSRSQPMRCVIINNTCTGNTYNGIGLSQDSSYNLVQGNDCSDNGRNGIDINTAHHNIVQNNDCSDNNDHGIRLPRGTTLQPTEYNIVANNTVESNDDDGIYIESRFHSILNNTMRWNTIGIHCRQSHIRIENNTCNQNSETGILCVDQYSYRYLYNVTLRNNTCGLNDNGIIFLKMSNCIVEDNYCGGNEFDGFKAGGSNTVIRNNRFGTNKLNGLYVTGTWDRNFIIENNICYWNLQHGILIDSSGYLTLLNNSCTINGMDGIAISGGGFITMEENVLFQNDRHGIRLYSGSDDCDISNNTFALCVNSAIKVENRGDSFTISDNLILEGNRGINMSSSYDSVIDGNTILDAKVGIQLSNCWRGLIYNNWVDCVTNSKVSGGGATRWNVSKTSGTNICGFGYLGGNYWGDYDGADTDGDWIGDTKLPHGPGDYLPLIKENMLPTIEDATIGFPTTGETFDIKVNVTDNRDVLNVFLLYWFGAGPRENVTMDKNVADSWNMTLEIPSDQAAKLKYIVVAVDTSFNWNQSVQRNLTVVDNDIPTINVTQTPSTATTGDSFHITVEVIDNIAIEQVWVEYWYNGTPVSKVDMYDFGNHLWKTTITVDDKVDPWHYVAYVNDTSGNWNRSVNMTVTVQDNDRPSITWWSTFDHLETGGTGHFAVKASDNIGVTEVQIEYWFEGGAHRTFTMDEGEPGTWEHDIDIPFDSLDSLHYGYHVFDEAGNKRTSSFWVVRIRDVIGPEIITDGTGAIAVVGEEFVFLLTASDNIAPTGAWVNYHFGEGNWRNTSMAMAEPGSFSLTITTPLSLDPLNYTLHVKDAAINWAFTEARIVQVIDNEAPEFIRDTTKAEATTGDPFYFSVDVNDNMGVAEVWVEYDIGPAGMTNASAELMAGNTWQLWISIPDDAESRMTYRVKAMDTYGNWVWTPLKELTVVDNDPPEIGPVALDVIWGYDEEYEILVDVTDNKLVSEVRIDIVPPSGDEESHPMTHMEGNTWSHTFTYDKLGRYGVTIWAFDAEGNDVIFDAPSFEVDDIVPPSIGVITVSPDVPEIGMVVKISVEVTDDYPIDYVWLVTNSPSGKTTNQSMMDQVDGTWSRENAFMEAGNYTFKVIALDISGNQVTGDTGTIEVKAIDDGGNGGNGGNGGGGEEPDGDTSSEELPWMMYAVIAVIAIVAVVAGVLGWMKLRKEPNP